MNIKQVELSILTGISKQTISTACRRNQLIKSADKKIDLNNETNRAWLEKRGVDVDKLIPSGKKEPVKSNKPQIKKAKAQVNHSIDNYTEDNSFASAEVRLKEAQANLKMLELAKETGLVILKDKVERLVDNFYKFNNEILTISDIISRDICEIFGVDDHEKRAKVKKTIDTRVSRSLRQIKNNMILTIE